MRTQDNFCTAAVIKIIIFIKNEFATANFILSVDIFYASQLKLKLGLG